MGAKFKNFFDGIKKFFCGIYNWFKGFHKAWVWLKKNWWVIPLAIIGIIALHYAWESFWAYRARKTYENGVQKYQIAKMKLQEAQERRMLDMRRQITQQPMQPRPPLRQTGKAV